MKNIATLILVFGLFLKFDLVYAQPGVSDPSFNIKDDCTYGSGESFDQAVYSTILQSDGKIIAGGDFTVYNGVSRSGIARINADGTLDQSFDPGTGCANIFTSYSPTSVQSLAIQSDGKILLGGNFLKYNGNNCRGLVRINSDGSIDKTFLIGIGVDAPIYKILIQSDGKILIAGNFTTFNGVSRNRIARLNSNGSLDTTFKPGTGFNNWVRTIALLSNGKILAGGMFNAFDGNTAVRIARLNTNGSYDASFITGTGFQNEVSSILPTSNGKIIVLGHFLSYKSKFINRIVRLDSIGGIDNSFNAGTGFDNGVYTASLQVDGKIIVGGSFINFDNKTMNRICRLNSNGSKDTTFKTDIPYIVGDIIFSISIQNDSKVVYGGKIRSIHEKNSLNYIERLDSNGRFDEDFNHGTGFQVADIEDFCIQQDQKILAGGTFYSYNGFKSACIARLNSDGEIDSSFNSCINYGATVRTISLQPNGKIIVGGGFGVINSPIMSILRLNTDGTVDTTFKIGKGCNSHAYSTAIQSDGKILIGGSFTVFKDSNISRIVRVFPNGIIDTSFKTGLSFNDVVYKLRVQPDGKILVCGRFTKYQNISNSGIIRLLPNGSIDSTFNSGTGIGSGFPSSGTAFATSIILQNDGKIIMVGNFTKYNNWTVNGIVRILSNGRFDSSFSAGAGFDAVPNEVLVQSDEKVVVSGNFTTYRSISRKGIVRILSDGLIDPSFNPGTGFNRHTKALSFHNGERILVGGDFTQFNGNCRTRIARLLNCESLSKQLVDNCGPYKWMNDSTYNKSTNVPFIELNNANFKGCDSFVVLNLKVKQKVYSEQVIKACKSYKWINGMTYNSSTDTVKYVITNGASNGCDSVISLKLTVNQPTMSFDPIQACKKYKWIDGVTYFNSNNTATYTYPGGAYNGCDSIVKLSLSILNVNNTVSKNLEVLTSNEFGAVYQWLYCDSSFKPVIGATTRTFIPQVSGNYAVSVTKNNCTDTSECIEVTIENNNISSHLIEDITLYPNPSDGLINVIPHTSNQFDLILIRDQFGRHIQSIPVTGGDSFELDLSSYNGLYILEFVNDTKIIKRSKVLIL